MWQQICTSVNFCKVYRKFCLIQMWYSEYIQKPCLPKQRKSTIQTCPSCIIQKQLTINYYTSWALFSYFNSIIQHHRWTKYYAPRPYSFHMQNNSNYENTRSLKYRILNTYARGCPWYNKSFSIIDDYKILVM